MQPHGKVAAHKLIFDPMTSFKQNVKNNLVLIAFVILLLGTLVACALPWLLTSYSVIDLTETGQIGDTIGGVMGPVIAIVASALTFLAFWVQYQANQEQRKEIASNKTEIARQQEKYLLDKFENELMTKMNFYQETVRSLRYCNHEGKVTFKYFLDELKLTYQVIEHCFIQWLNGGMQNPRPEFEESFRDFCTYLMKDELNLRSFLTETAYALFFYGKTYYPISYTKENQGRVTLMDELYKRVKNLENSISEGNAFNFSLYMIKGNEKTYRYTAPCTIIQGHSDQLGQYYRLLFNIAETIDKCDLKGVGYEQKYQYFKQLRCLMTDEEQALFYYNSISTIGRAWNTHRYSNSDDINYDTMGLVGKYSMIKNLPPRFSFFGYMPMEYFKNETLFYNGKGRKFYEHDSFGIYDKKIWYEQSEESNVINKVMMSV